MTPASVVVNLMGIAMTTRQRSTVSYWLLDLVSVHAEIG